jgi:hypothetical protein
LLLLLLLLLARDRAELDQRCKVRNALQQLSCAVQYP